MNPPAIRTLHSRTRRSAVAVPVLLVSLVALQGCDVVTADLNGGGAPIRIEGTNGGIRIAPR